MRNEEQAIQEKDTERSYMIHCTGESKKILHFRMPRLIALDCKVAFLYAVTGV